MSCVRAPMIGVKAGESNRLQERFELEQNVVFAAAKDIRQDAPGACSMACHSQRWLPFLSTTLHNSSIMWTLAPRSAALALPLIGVGGWRTLV